MKKVKSTVGILGAIGLALGMSSTSARATNQEIAANVSNASTVTVAQNLEEATTTKGFEKVMVKGPIQVFRTSTDGIEGPNMNVKFSCGANQSGEDCIDFEKLSTLIETEKAQLKELEEKELDLQIQNLRKLAEFGIVDQEEVEETISHIEEMKANGFEGKQMIPPVPSQAAVSATITEADSIEIKLPEVSEDLLSLPVTLVPDGMPIDEGMLIDVEEGVMTLPAIGLMPAMDINGDFVFDSNLTEEEIQKHNEEMVRHHEEMQKKHEETMAKFEALGDSQKQELQEISDEMHNVKLEKVSLLSDFGVIDEASAEEMAKNLDEKHAEMKEQGHFPMIKVRKEKGPKGPKAAMGVIVDNQE